MSDLLGYIPAGVATLAAVGWLVQRARKAARSLDVVERLVRRELEHNHGSSMKDDTHGMAVAIGVLQRDMTDVQRRLGTIEGNTR